MDIGNFLDENNHGGIIQENDVFTHPEMVIEENIIEDKKPIKKTWNWKKAIAKELMLGKHKADIINKFGKIIENAKNRDKILNYIDKYDGVIGFIVIDSSVFDDKFNFKNIPAKNKEYAKFAINSPKLLEQTSEIVEQEFDGTLDGFLNSDDKATKNIYYIDEATGMMPINSIDVIAYEDLITIAEEMYENKAITFSQLKAINNAKNPITIMKKIWRGDNNKTLNAPIENVVDDYQLNPYEINEDINKQQDNINMTVIENKLDGVDVDNSYGVGEIEINPTKEEEVDEFEIKDYDDEFETDDLKESEYDDFELFDDVKQDIDEDEYFAQDLFDDDIKIDKKQEEFKVSNKFEFGW